MLSAKVICGIQILRELAIQQGQPEQPWLKAAELKKRGIMQDTLYSKILSRLRERGYIEQIGNRYRIATDLTEVTLGDLIETFHNGIVVGETFATTSNKIYRYMEQYRGLTQTEQEVSDQIQEILHQNNLHQILFSRQGER